MADLLGTLKRHRLGLFVLLVGVLLAWMLWSVKGALAAFIIGVALAFVLDPLVTLQASDFVFVAEPFGPLVLVRPRRS